MCRSVYNFVSEPDDTLKCLVCLEVARDPWQHGKCGRLFCEQCLDQYGKGQPCPNCRMKKPMYLEDTKSKLSNTFSMLLHNCVLCVGKREIQALSIKCEPDNVKRGCEWEGTVCSLDKHLDECNFSLVPCPKKCKKSLLLVRKDLDKHLNEECLKVLRHCPNSECPEMMGNSKVKEHVEHTCKYTVVSCKYKTIGCRVKLKKKDMRSHELDAKPHFCQALDTVLQLQDNLELATKTIALERKERKDLTVKLQSAMDTVVSIKQESGEKFTSAMNTIVCMRKEIDDMAIKYKKLQESDDKLTSAMNTIASMRKEIGDMAIEYKKLRDDTDLLQKESITFKLREYENKRCSNEMFLSEAFYTFTDGYHLRVAVCPYGTGSGRGTHVSVFAQVLCGDHDVDLNWPFTGTLKFELLNQLANDNHHLRMLAIGIELDTQVGSTWGDSMFIPHSQLSHDPVKNTQYLKNDTLYFRVSVEVSGHKPWLECTLK